jgi:hypothetical protein
MRGASQSVPHFTFAGWGIHRAFSGMQRIHQGMTPEACGWLNVGLHRKSAMDDPPNKASHS